VGATIAVDDLGCATALELTAPAAASTIDRSWHSGPMGGARDPLHDYYELGRERDRLDDAAGALEFVRTKELILRHLPDRPCVVADIGGGPGRYSIWLAGLGHTVRHRDVVPLHVEQAAEASDHLDGVEVAVGDARDLDLADDSVDAVLLLGPMYHLQDVAERRRALAEARRVVKPGGLLFIAAISRWAARLHGVLTEQLYIDRPEIVAFLPQIEQTGVVAPRHHASFTGYAHRPEELADEVRAADLDLVELVNVEGPAALLGDLAERLADADHASVVIDSARALEHVPELLGCGPHMLAIARRPASPD
jgi:SAM-dependent methyltransferase